MCTEEYQVSCCKLTKPHINLSLINKRQQRAAVLQDFQISISSLRLVVVHKIVQISLTMLT